MSPVFPLSQRLHGSLALSRAVAPRGKTWPSAPGGDSALRSGPPPGSVEIRVVLNTMANSG